MTTIGRAAVTRQVYFHDPGAPAATVVVPSVFVAERWTGGRLLLLHETSEAACIAFADLPGLWSHRRGG